MKILGRALKLDARPDTYPGAGPVVYRIAITVEALLTADEMAVLEAHVLALHPEVWIEWREHDRP